MPNTTTATWVDAVTGRKARASEVNGNFDYSEHSLWPHSTGTKVTNTYYLGDTDAAWKGVYTYSLDPLGSTGVAIGTTTVANASSTSLELGGAKAFLLPRLTTTQRDALTAVSGMYIFNTTADRTELYRNSAWEGNDVPIGMIAKTTGSIAISSLTSVVNVSGSGRLIHVQVVSPDNNSVIKVTMDSVTSELTLNTTATMYLSPEFGATTASFRLSEALTGAQENWGPFFKNQLQILIRDNNDSSTITAWCMYESS